MMNKVFKYIIAIAGVVLTSCSLDINQPDYILDQDVLKTVDDANLVIIGAYGQMPSSGPIEISSRIADDNRIAESNTGQGKQIHTWGINSGTNEASSNWAVRFRPILNVNKLFESINSLEVKTEEDELRLKQYEAEGYAIRAYMHFELLRLYGEFTNLNSPYGIPYITKSGIDTPKRLNVADSYDKIEADLLSALKLMPESFDDKFRITKDAIRAMLSRLYFYKKDYDNAIKYSSELISTMQLNSIGTYANLWDDTDYTEVIFALQKVHGDGAIGSLYTNSAGQIMFHPSYGIINVVSQNPEDVRNGVIYKMRAEDGEFVVAKYLGTETDPGLNNVKLFRLSEQYLIRAEAYARTGNLVASANDYNKLRENRIPGYLDEVFNSKNVALNRILTERRIELAFEGHRWFDLRRYQKDIVRLEEDVVLIPNYKELPATDHRFKYLPIPQDEVFANDNMEQNNGF